MLVVGLSFGIRVSGFGIRIPGFGIRVSSLGIGVSGFGIRVPGFRFRISEFGARVSAALAAGVTRGAGQTLNPQSRTKSSFSGPSIALARAEIRRFLAQIKAIEKGDLIGFDGTLLPCPEHGRGVQIYLT